jgi:hypothetical protein
MQLLWWRDLNGFKKIYVDLKARPLGGYVYLCAVNPTYCMQFSGQVHAFMEGVQPVAQHPAQLDGKYLWHSWGADSPPGMEGVGPGAAGPDC